MLTNQVCENSPNVDTIISLNEPVSIDDYQETGFLNEQPETISDALLYCLAEKGKVDINYIARQTNEAPLSVIQKLKGYIFLNPEHFNGNILEGWETKEKYLNGNLVAKYWKAKQANNQYKDLFDDNIKEIKKEINKSPKVEAKDIFVTLGTPWLSANIIKAFIKEKLDIATEITHDEKTGSWTVSAISWRRNVLSTAKYGTPAMDAIQIINRTLNQTPIVVNNIKRTKSEKTTRNEKETMFAIEKQRALIEEFERWIKSTPDRCQLIETLYNNRYGYNSVRHYDGSFLTFPDLNKDISLYQYQKDAIARMILTPNTLLAHDVGSGKTFEMICAAHEMKRMGLSKKPLIVVPNNIISQWKTMYRKLYPNDNILVVEPHKFGPSVRNDVLNQIIYNDFDAIIMAYSSFDLIELSPDELKIKYDEERKQIRESFVNRSKTTSIVKRNFTNLLNGKLDEQIAKLGTRDPNKIYFDDLGIDRLFLDEAHNYKNVPIRSNIRALGINKSGSQQCEMMMEKVHYIQRHNDGGGIVFATGTPITNSITDVYTIQKYLQEGELAMLNIDSFNSWVSNFAELSQEYEIDVDTSTYRLVSRYSKFHNLPELSSLLSNIADFHHVDKDNDLPDFDGYNDVMIKESPEFGEFLKSISCRADEIRKGKPTVRKAKGTGEDVSDNMLLVTRDGRDAALDLRLFDYKAQFNNESKVAKCADKVASIYKTTSDKKLTQLIFCDTSTPNSKGFNIYDELKRLLLLNGVKEEEIAYIHDADTDSRRLKLFAKVNSGEIRVLIGSTFKLGLGVNVQEKLYAIHHIDIPWRPSDMIQREGRILRSGNTNEKVYIYRYITEHSFDAYSWQLLETKQNFISKLLSNKVDNRHINDIDDTVLNYAEVKALAVGNPLIKERIEINNQISRLFNLQNKQTERLSHLKLLKEQILESKPKYIDEINKTENDLKYVKSRFDLFDKTTNDYIDLGEEIIKQTLINQESSEEINVGEYFDFKVIVPAFTGLYEHKFVYLERKNRYKVFVGSSASGNVTRLNNYLKALDKYLDELKSRLELQNKDFKSAEIELRNTVDYQEEIKSLKEKLLIIDSKLGLKEEK